MISFHLFVDCGIQDKVTVDIPFKITRDKKKKKIITKEMKKDYRVVYNKRVVTPQLRNSTLRLLTCYKKQCTYSNVLVHKYWGIFKNSFIITMEVIVDELKKNNVSYRYRKH